MPTLPKALRPFEDGRYRLLTVALAMSLFGGGVWLVGMVAAVFEIGGGPADLSLIAAGNALGMIVAVLVGGVLADRFRQQRLLLWVEIARTAVVAVVIVLAATGGLALWELAIASLLLGLAEGIFYPAYSALLPRIVRGELLLAANGVEGMLRPLAHDAAGPAIGGLAMAVWDPSAAFWLIGIAQLVAIGCLLLLRGVVDRPARGDAPGGIVGFARDAGSGFAYVVRTRWLLWTLVYACIVILFLMGPIEVLIPFAVRDHAGGGTVEYSMVLAAFGIGAALGSLVVGSLRMPRRYLTMMNLLWVLGMLPLALFGFVDALWVMVAAAALIGGLDQGATVIWGTILQRRVPSALLGRVSSLDFFVSLALMPVSMALAGPIADAVGLVPVFLVAALVPLPLGVAALLIGRMHIDEIEHPLPDADESPAEADPAADLQPAPDER